MSFLKPRIAAALPLVLADWRANGMPSGERELYNRETSDLQVIADVHRDFNRACLTNGEFGPDEMDLLNAYDLVTDPANRELVDRIATELYA